jgi:hypothetical protein
MPSKSMCVLATKRGFRDVTFNGLNSTVRRDRLSGGATKGEAEMGLFPIEVLNDHARPRAKPSNIPRDRNGGWSEHPIRGENQLIGLPATSVETSPRRSSHQRNDHTNRNAPPGHQNPGLRKDDRRAHHEEANGEAGGKSTSQ